MIPAIRGHQGGRVFYSSMLGSDQLEDEWFRRAEPATDRAQRPPMPSHIKAIQEYIVANPYDYVLGSLTFAVDNELEFCIAENLGNFEIGILQLDQTSTLHSLDGQHRFKAILGAVKEGFRFSGQSVGILIYVEPNLARKKQMFSDMNSTPKKVPKGLNISFDNRDPFGRAAKHLVNIHPILKDRTEMFASRVLAKSKNFYSLSSVQDTLKKLHVGSIGRVKNIHTYLDSQIIVKGETFFDALHEARPEFDVALQSQLKLNSLRQTTILFNSTTLRVIAGAHFLMEKYFVGDPNSFQKAFTQRLGQIDFKKNSKLFVRCGFVDRNSSTPNARNQQVAAGTEALFTALIQS
jgi:DNA sulfur modification protein DndB